METMNTDREVKKDNASQFFNLDDDSAETFSFKPLSKGLGFHHEVKEPPKRIKRTPVRTVTESRMGLTSVDLKNKGQALSHTSALDKFYGKTKNQELSSETAPLVEKKPKKIRARKIKRASLVDIASAWFIDFIVFASSQVFLLIAMTTFLSVETNFLLSKEYLPYLIIIGTINYLIYNSVLSCSRGLGANLMRIILVTRTNGAITFTHAFYRTIFSILSLLALGLPLLFDVHGKLSNTKWIVKND